MIEVKHSMSSLKEEQESQRFRRKNRHVNVTRTKNNNQYGTSLF